MGMAPKPALGTPNSPFKTSKTTERLPVQVPTSTSHLKNGARKSWLPSKISGLTNERSASDPKQTSNHLELQTQGTSVIA